jgi:hypothetical protein
MAALVASEVREIGVRDGIVCLKPKVKDPMNEYDGF